MIYAIALTLIAVVLLWALPNTVEDHPEHLKDHCPKCGKPSVYGLTCIKCVSAKGL
jgi:hypothetical protein